MGEDPPASTPTDRPRPRTLYLLVAALAFQGVSGVAGGFGLIADPSGQAVGLPIGWLVRSPFPDYLVPGLVLFLLLGVVPLGVAWAVWTRRRRAWLGALLVGVALVTWILVQILIVGYQPTPPLQAIYGALGVALIVLASRHAMRRG